LTGSESDDSGTKDQKAARKSNNVGDAAIRRYLNTQISRRAAIGTGAKVGIGVAIAAIAGVGIYEAYAASSGSSSSTTSSTTTTTSSTAANNLSFKHWNFENAQVSSYVKTFDTETGFNTSESYLDNNTYNPLIEAAFQSGEIIDMHYANGYEVPRLLSLGYDKDTSTMTNISQIQSEMYPSIVDSLSTVNGVLYGLCYYWSARPILSVNDAVLNQTSLAGKRPAGWKDMWTDSAVTVQKAGIVQYPVMPSWFSANYGIGWGFMGEVANTFNDADDTQSLFNKSFAPVFDTNTDIADLLTTWATATKSGLVDPAVFSQASESDGVAAGSTGKYAYTATAFYDFQSLNTPTSSQIPVGDANLCDTTTTQSGWGMIETGVYCWPKVTHSDANSQQIIKWFGYKDPTTGKRITQPAWAIAAALGSGYPDTLQDPTVTAGYQSWLGDRTTSTLSALSNITNGDKTPWVWKSLIYTSWQDTIYPVLSSVASGVLPVSQGITTMRNLADQLYQSTYGSTSST
jgi:hypothetical protein